MSRWFTIATSGRPESGLRRWWFIAIHPDLGDLRDAATRRSPWHDFRDAVGVCQPTQYAQNSLTGEYRYPLGGYAGIIRFAEGHITSEIVAHELLHAAVAVYRMNRHRDVRLGLNCAGREETLAYIYGELYAALVELLDDQEQVRR